MFFWKAKAQFSDPNGTLGVSSWAVEAHTSDEARGMISNALAREGLSLTSIDLVEVSGFSEVDPTLPSLGEFEVLREGRREWLGGQNGQCVRAIAVDLETCSNAGPDWISPDLWDALFAQEDKANVFAVLDGDVWNANCPAEIAEMAEEPGVVAQPLYNSDGNPEIDAASPWVVDLGLSTVPSAPPSELHRHLFQNLWQKNFGIFLRFDGSLVQLRTQLRKLTKFRDLDDSWYFNRFWEPEFFLYFTLFLSGRRLLAPLADVRGFAIQVDGGVIAAETNFAACKDASADPEGDLDRLFEAGTAMVSIRAAREMEAEHMRGVDPDEVYSTAQQLFGLSGLDYRFARKFTQICYALMSFYGDNAVAALPEKEIRACFDDDGSISSQIEFLYGRCMFALKQNVPPADLRVTGVY